MLTWNLDSASSLAAAVRIESVGLGESSHTPRPSGPASTWTVGSCATLAAISILVRWPHRLGPDKAHMWLAAKNLELESPIASYVTGHAVGVDGGITAGLK
jgi:hypothetical protein